MFQDVAAAGPNEVGKGVRQSCFANWISEPAHPDLFIIESLAARGERNVINERSQNLLFTFLRENILNFDDYVTGKDASNRLA